MSSFGDGATSTAFAAICASPTLWHHRLGHPSTLILASLVRENKLPCTSSLKCLNSLYNACQLGKHHKLPFTNSSSFTSFPFELIHSDIRTSPIPHLLVFAITYSFMMISLSSLGFFLLNAKVKLSQCSENFMPMF